MPSLDGFMADLKGISLANRDVSEFIIHDDMLTGPLMALPMYRWDNNRNYVLMTSFVETEGLPYCPYVQENK